MLVIRPIAGDQSRYYLEGPAPGRWVGGGSQDLGLGGEVDEASLRAVLAGRQPGGDRLLPTRAARRRDGFDLILAAPKSVSLVAALADDCTRDRIRQGHDQAVESTLAHLERQALRTRRGAEHRHLSTSGFVAAAFPHSRSAAGDPHLHTHVVVANLVCAEGKWSSLDSRSLYRDGRAAGAVFQASLRYQLDQQGFRFQWRVDRHGLGDIVGVSREAIEAASLRHHQVRAEIDTGLAGRLGRATAAARTRRSHALDRDHDPPGPGTDGPTPPASPGQGNAVGWRTRVAAAGLDDRGIDQLLANAVARHRAALPQLGGADLGALERALSDRHSQFRRADVVRAAAGLSVSGAAPSDVERLAQHYLETGAVSAGTDAWTTASLRRMEQAILTASRPGRPVGLAAASTPLPQYLDPPAMEAVRRLTRGGAPVDVVRGNLIAQAQVIEAARDAWVANGHQVSLLSPTERGHARWQVLAGLRRPPASGHPTVVVLDNADRWSTSDLHRVITDAAARQAKVVLLDGASAPRRTRPESPAMEALRHQMPVVEAGRDPPPVPPPTTPPRPQVLAGRNHEVIVTDRTSAAIHRIVEDWHRDRLSGKKARMVAMGPEEAEHLNDRARAALQAAGELCGPAVELAGRRFQVGDDVMALRRDGRLGVSRGRAVGKVTAVDPDRAQISIQWTGHDDPVVVTAGTAELPLTHAYATTPPYLRGDKSGPILGLGHIEALNPGLRPDRVYEVVPPSTDRHRDLSPLSALLAELPAPATRSSGSTVDASVAIPVLAAERDALAGQLLRTLPTNPAAALRRLEEESHWLRSAPGRAGGDEALAALDRQRLDLVQASAARRDWIEAHRGQLERWEDLSGSIAWREAALGRGAEIRPTAAVRALVGSPPTEPTELAVWRRAAEAIESHRERWNLADRSLDLDHAPLAGHDTARRADELQVLAASREAERSRSRERGHALSPAGP